jgi:hypothetical protein
MVKEKINIGCRIKHLFTHHPWLKIIALGLSVMLWFYVQGEIGRFNF